MLDTRLTKTITDSDLARGAIGLMTSSTATDFGNVRIEGVPAAVNASDKLAASWGYLKTIRHLEVGR